MVRFQHFSIGLTHNTTLVQQYTLINLYLSTSYNNMHMCIYDVLCWRHTWTGVILPHIYFCITAVSGRSAGLPWRDPEDNRDINVSVFECTMYLHTFEWICSSIQVYLIYNFVVGNYQWEVSCAAHWCIGFQFICAFSLVANCCNLPEQDFTPSQGLQRFCYYKWLKIMLLWIKSALAIHEAKQFVSITTSTIVFCFIYINPHCSLFLISKTPSIIIYKNNHFK